MLRTGNKVKYTYHSQSLPREVRTGERRPGILIQFTPSYEMAYVDFGEFGMHLIAIKHLKRVVSNGR